MADVDAYMGHRPAVDVEEYQISGMQVPHMYGVTVLLAYRARNPDAGMGVAVMGEAAAVEARRAVAAVTVGMTQHPVGCGDNGGACRNRCVVAYRRRGAAAQKRRREGGESDARQHAPAGVDPSVQVDCH